MPRFLLPLCVLLGVALLSSGCQTRLGSAFGKKGAQPGAAAVEAGSLSAEDLAQPEVVRSKLKATQLEVLKVESFTVMPVVTQRDGSLNNPHTYVTIELRGRPYYATSTVTSARLRFLPPNWGGPGRPAYRADRNRIVADFPLDQAGHFHQFIKDGREVLCLFVHSDALAKSECHVLAHQKK